MGNVIYWELFKKLNSGCTAKENMHKLGSVQKEKEMHKIVEKFSRILRYKWISKSGPEDKIEN